jgi:tetratricopeptide (TPR) repeat protein
MEDAVSKYNINVHRDVFLIGEAHHAAVIKKLLKSYQFLTVRSVTELAAAHDEQHFVVAAVDFTNTRSIAFAARSFAQAGSPFTHRIVLAVSPDPISSEQRLFCNEIGARFVATGEGRYDTLKDYLKRICVEAHHVGSLAAFETDLANAAKAQDREAARRTLTKLRAIPGESEDLVRLQAVAYIQLNELRRAESLLKRLLAINPQNLWAANELGRLLLASGRGAEGIETLQKLSQFHELNSERMLELGNAYARAGLAREAEASFKSGDAMAPGADFRFKEGLAKVKLLDADYAGAVASLGAKELSREVLAFMNLRAIMAVRSRRVEEGIQYYKYAVDGCPDKTLRAKLLFNMGLAYARLGDLESARSSLETSALLGGDRFSRARGPLEVVKNVIKSRDPSRPQHLPAAPIITDDADWETLF